MTELFDKIQIGVGLLHKKVAQHSSKTGIEIVKDKSELLGILRVKPYENTLLGLQLKKNKVNTIDDVFFADIFGYSFDYSFYDV